MYLQMKHYLTRKTKSPLSQMCSIFYGKNTAHSFLENIQTQKPPENGIMEK